MKTLTDSFPRPPYNNSVRDFESTKAPQPQQTNTKDDYRAFFECGRVEIKSKTE
jgi:hypothetical protein